MHNKNKLKSHIKGANIKKVLMGSEKNWEGNFPTKALRDLIT